MKEENRRDFRAKYAYEKQNFIYENINSHKKYQENGWSADYFFMFSVWKSVLVRCVKHFKK